MIVDLGLLGPQNGTGTLLIGIGAVTVASIVLTVLRVLLSTFVLPGQSVRFS